jgi:hypothetical protein
MEHSSHPRTVRVLFDEYHSESWTISRERAVAVNPEYPDNSSYASAAAELAAREFELVRNIDRPLDDVRLRDVDVLVLPHPCASAWERTTSVHSPRLDTAELEAVERFVVHGGALLVITEYENDKYGNNLNTLLGRFGLAVTNDTVVDRAHHERGNPTWVHADTDPGHSADGILHLVHRACFYRAGACEVGPRGWGAVRAHRSAQPPNAVLIGLTEAGAGRVAVVSDSDLFGDEFIGESGHRQLWMNLMYWLALPAFRRGKPATDAYIEPDFSSLWASLRDEVNGLRKLQNPDGSLPDAGGVRSAARDAVAGILALLPRLRAHVPDQTGYLKAVAGDLASWCDGDFGRPDFTRALAAFTPQDRRVHGARQLVLFPMSTPNASTDTRFECLLMEVIWPRWLAEIQARFYRDNQKFVSARLLAHTDGYDSECAVFFPDTVSIAGRDDNKFGVIFCDREAERFRLRVGRAATALRLQLPPDLEALMADPEMIMNTYALWDLAHDTSHSRGDLPFDPFMVRQRAPYWMYAIEELRVDLCSFLDVKQLERVYPLAGYVRYAVLLDRTLRFAVTGARKRNYDGLAGQLLFNALHARGVLVSRSNRFTVDWQRLPAAVEQLHDELVDLYRTGQVVSKVTYWSMAHDFMCRYLVANVASKWVAPRRAFISEDDPKSLISLVHDDEFPLGNFHQALQRTLAAPT